MTTTDRFVTHVSTVPATRGQTVGLFVREKALEATIAPGAKPHVVVMVHGGFAPASVAYDLEYGDYSFMDALARAGFDVFVLFGPAPFFASDEPPAEMPERGAPAILQTKEFLLHRRWQDHVRCEGQLEDPGVCEAVWQALMALDEVGARWGREGQGIMRAPSRTNFGWRRNLARIRAPTLMLLGEFDNYAKRLQAWRGLGAERKLFIRVACASHFMQFERGRHLLYRATADWLRTGAVQGVERGELATDASGNMAPNPA